MKRIQLPAEPFFQADKAWKAELHQLRRIVLDAGLTETLKWGAPCYTYDGKNVAILGGFKGYCVLSFFKGALLKDEHGMLQKPGDHTQSARILKFTSEREIVEKEQILKDYILESIDLERNGQKVKFSKHPEPIPDELKKKLVADPALKKAFSVLTPGRQRAYILYFSAPKQSGTREARVEKYISKILQGKGINDR